MSVFVAVMGVRGLIKLPRVSPTHWRTYYGHRVMKKKKTMSCRLDRKAFIIFMLHFRSSLPSESFCSFTPCVTHMTRVVTRKRSSAALMSAVSVDKLTADCCQLCPLLMICPPKSIKLLRGYSALKLSLRC